MWACSPASPQPTQLRVRYSLLPLRNKRGFPIYTKQIHSAPTLIGPFPQKLTFQPSNLNLTSSRHHHHLSTTSPFLHPTTSRSFFLFVVLRQLHSLRDTARCYGIFNIIVALFSNLLIVTPEHSQQLPVV